MNEQKIEDRIPNGDVTIHLKAMEKEIKAMREKTEKGESISPRDKAHFIVVSKLLSEALEFYTNFWGGDFKKDLSFKEDFIDLGKTVSIQQGAQMSSIDKAAFNELTIDEIKIAASLTQTGLKDAGRAELIEKYKLDEGRKANSLKIGKLK